MSGNPLDVPDTRVLLGVSWRDGAPHVRVRDNDQPVSTLEPAAGLRLSYRLDGEPARQCVGHKPWRANRGDFHDCRRAPQAGGRTCDRCSAAEATFASNLHHAHTRGWAELDPSIQDHLQQPNRLYVAAFRDGTLKIGTTTASRAETRLAEQGAWMARFVAETADGLAVRRLEDAVTERIGLGQAVQGRRKVAGLVSPMTDEALAAKLVETAASVAALVADRGTSRVLGDAASPGEEWHHPLAGHDAARRPIAYPLRLNQGNHDLVVETAIGRTMLARRADGDDIFAIDPSPLFGLVLDMGDYGSDEIAIQDSLF